MTDPEPSSVNADIVRLDPFAFLASSASRIVGLGSSEPPNDAAYAFHTPYEKLTTGQTTFILRFRGLRASVGNLTLLINSISPLAGSVARTVKMSAYNLRDVMMTGDLSLTVKTKAHLSYAVLGFVYGPTNASAEALEVEAHQSPDTVAAAPVENEIVYTEFGDVPLRQISLLASDLPATLVKPVSQTPTTAQYLEPAFGRWSQLIGRSKDADETTWARTYVLSALECYGMMAKGASGFGVCNDGESVHNALAAAGTTSALFSADVLSAALADLRNQDFSWSINSPYQPAMSIMTHIELMLEPLKMGGLSVYVLPYDGSHPGGNWRSHDNVATRSDLDRVIFQLLTAGHDVAQLKIGSDLHDVICKCVGIIVRKGRSTFY